MKRKSGSKAATATIFILLIIAIAVMGYYTISIFLLLDFSTANKFYWKYFSNLVTAIICLVAGFGASYYYFSSKRENND